MYTTRDTLYNPLELPPQELNSIIYFGRGPWPPLKNLADELYLSYNTKPVVSRTLIQNNIKLKTEVWVYPDLDWSNSFHYY